MNTSVSFIGDNLEGEIEFLICADLPRPFIFLPFYLFLFLSLRWRSSEFLFFEDFCGRGFIGRSPKFMLALEKLMDVALSGDV